MLRIFVSTFFLISATAFAQPQGGRAGTPSNGPTDEQFALIKKQTLERLDLEIAAIKNNRDCISKIKSFQEMEPCQRQYVQARQAAMMANAPRGPTPIARPNQNKPQESKKK